MSFTPDYDRFYSKMDQASSATSFNVSGVVNERSHTTQTFKSNDVDKMVLASEYGMI